MPSSDVITSKSPFQGRVAFFVISITVVVIVHGGFVLTSLALVADLPVSRMVVLVAQFLFFYVMGIGAFAAVAAIVTGPIFLFRPRKRTLGIGMACVAVVFLVTAWIGASIISNVRRSSFVKLAERSAPLVAAIDSYYRDTGRPPMSLDQLVPVYLKSIPATGMSGYPNYSYSAGNTSAIGREPWTLWVATPSGFLDFDRFVYFPSQDYPEQGESGFYEQIGTWAYYHE